MVETPLTRESAITLAIYVYYIYVLCKLSPLVPDPNPAGNVFDQSRLGQKLLLTITEVRRVKREVLVSVGKLHTGNNCLIQNASFVP